ncbi:MAG: 4'-phosphopantetheinyl transferase superfamily protein [Syntrophales bacterium]|nr:4'-phosphopantetheinyl transferase superfamily protein [Syntrophales bacterium]
MTDAGARGKSRNIRFVNRVFIPDEQRQIFDSSHPDIVLWALWAGKETAYKIIRKSISGAPFIPLLYKVSCPENCKRAGRFPLENDHIPGITDTPWGKVTIRIFITCDYIHCIGTMDLSGGIDSVVWKVDLLPPVAEAIAEYEDESAFLRETIRRHLSVFLNRTPEEIEIRRSEGALGPPFVYLKDKPAGIDISLSHDGKFTAYAFIISGDKLFSIS